MRSAFVRLTVVSCLLAGTGCASLETWIRPVKLPEPWVKPYERNHLADPIMSMQRHGLADSYMNHVFQSREGARGAEGGSGGGCGCN